MFNIFMRLFLFFAFFLQFSHFIFFEKYFTAKFIINIFYFNIVFTGIFRYFSRINTYNFKCIFRTLFFIAYH